MRTHVLLASLAAAAVIAVAAILALRAPTPPDRAAPAAALTPAPALSQAAAPAGPAAQVPPAAVVPGKPAQPPSFDVVTVDPKGQAVIAGRAEPGDRIRVLDGGKPIGEVTADTRGEWVLVPTAPLAPGNRELSAEAAGRDGEPVRRSNDVVALSVSRPAAPGDGAATTAVLLPADAAQDAKVLQQPAPASGVPMLALDTVQYGAGARLALAGHAEPGARVAVYAGDRLLGTATADPAGKWSLAAPHQPVGRGVELRLDQLAADGHVVSRIAAPVEAPDPAAVRSRTYFVQRGNSLWVIARNLYGEGMRYTAIYSANRDQIRNPDLIYPGQLFKIPKS